MISQGSGTPETYQSGRCTSNGCRSVVPLSFDVGGPFQNQSPSQAVLALGRASLGQCYLTVANYQLSTAPALQRHLALVTDAQHTAALTESGFPCQFQSICCLSPLVGVIFPCSSAKVGRNVGVFLSPLPPPPSPPILLCPFGYLCCFIIAGTAQRARLDCLLLI